MQIKKLKLNVSPSIGQVSAILLTPSHPNTSTHQHINTSTHQHIKFLHILAHGAGAGMEHPFMENLALALAENDIATLRFNFPYMEQGKRSPDRPAKAHETIEAAIKKAAELMPGLPLLVGGKSFGGRMTSQLAAEKELPNVKGLVYYGFPLHAPGRAGKERATHLRDISLPMLFHQGTRDTLANATLIQEVCDELPTARLIFYEGGDHSFKMLKRSGITQEEVVGRIAVNTDEWCK